MMLDWYSDITIPQDKIIMNAIPSGSVSVPFISRPSSNARKQVKLDAAVRFRIVFLIAIIIALTGLIPFP